MKETNRIIKGDWLEGGKLFPLNVTTAQVTEIYEEIKKGLEEQ